MRFLGVVTVDHTGYNKFSQQQQAHLGGGTGLAGLQFQPQRFQAGIGTSDPALHSSGVSGSAVNPLNNMRPVPKWPINRVPVLLVTGVVLSLPTQNALFYPLPPPTLCKLVTHVYMQQLTYLWNRSFYRHNLLKKFFCRFHVLKAWRKQMLKKFQKIQEKQTSIETNSREVESKDTRKYHKGWASMTPGKNIATCFFCLGWTQCMRVFMPQPKRKQPFSEYYLPNSEFSSTKKISWHTTSGCVFKIRGLLNVYSGGCNVQCNVIWTSGEKRSQLFESLGARRFV